MYHLLSSPGLKGHASFCHHLASVVRPLSVRHPQFLFQSSPLKPSGEFQPNFAGSIYMRSFFKVYIFHPDSSTNLAAMGYSCFRLAEKKSSPRKPPSQMNWFNRYHLYEILYKVTWFPPVPSTNMAVMGDSWFWLVEIGKNPPLKSLSMLNWYFTGSIYRYEVLYKVFLFHSDLLNKLGHHERLLYLIDCNGIFLFLIG